MTTLTKGRPRTFDPANPAALEAWLAQATGAASVKITQADVLSGGAVQENWRLAVDVTGGPRQGRHTWVLRTDAAARIPLSLDRASEFAVLKAAYNTGVLVPEPIARCADPSVIGAAFLVQAHATGIAQARKIVRDPAIGEFGAKLAGDLGAALAAIHKLSPSKAELPCLALPIRPPGRSEVQRLRAALDTASEPRPALEYILAWLDAKTPERRPLALVHGDFRTGNYMVDDGRLTAILDWEFAHWGDIHEDIGWFCARCWRFGADDKQAGGIADRTAFYRGYDSVADEPLDQAVVAYWEIYALAKWAAVAVLQGDRYRRGGETAIELALTGLMPPEMELDALDIITALEQSGGIKWQ